MNVVGILDEKERIEEEGGPYAGSLIVELPEDYTKRNEIIKFYKKEMKEQGIEKRRRNFRMECKQLGCWNTWFWLVLIIVIPDLVQVHCFLNTNFSKERNENLDREISDVTERIKDVVSMQVCN